MPGGYTVALLSRPPASPRPELGGPGKRGILKRVLQGGRPTFTVLEPRLLVILIQ